MYCIHTLDVTDSNFRERISPYLSSVSLILMDRPAAKENLGRSIAHVPCNEGTVLANWEGGPVGAPGG